jgi:hypothetical protein
VFDGVEPSRVGEASFLREPTLAGEISPTKALVDFGNSKVEFPDQEEVALVYFKIN